MTHITGVAFRHEDIPITIETEPTQIISVSLFSSLKIRYISCIWIKSVYAVFSLYDNAFFNVLKTIRISVAPADLFPNPFGRDHISGRARIIYRLFQFFECSGIRVRINLVVSTASIEMPGVAP